MSDWQSYFYPDSEVLRNKFGITDADELERAERFIVEHRIREGIPTGNFDLAHLQAIHRHLFQDVYEWAGELRTVGMVKGGSSFIPANRIEMGMADVHRRLADANFLKDLDAWAFAAKAGEIIGDVNHAHPFREGNGRTQLQYLKLLAEEAGHKLDLTKFERDAWIQASIEANGDNCGRMIDHIRQAIVPDREKTPSEGTQRATEQPTLSPEELAGIREAFKDRHDQERRTLVDTHKAQRGELSCHGNGSALEKLTERQAMEIFQQDKIQKEELARYILERDEARQREEQRERQTRRRDEAGGRER